MHFKNFKALQNMIGTIRYDVVCVGLARTHGMTSTVYGDTDTCDVAS